VTEYYQKLIEYFRRCYRADSSDLAISNIDRIQKRRWMVLSGEEVLATGSLPRLPLVDSEAEYLLEQADIYRRERRLIYGCFLLQGNLDVESGLVRRRRIRSPLFYFPAELSREGELFLDIHRSDLRVNTALLRLLLKPEADSVALETFPALKFPIDTDQLATLGGWLRSYTIVSGLEEIGRWPNLALSESNRRSSSSVSLSASAFIILADRTRGSRGVLHELGLMGASGEYAKPVRELFGETTTPEASGNSDVKLIPGLLSEVQSRALRNAARYSLSLLSGPPGTGKSYTVAAMALDRLLQGESVLVVAKTEQAVNVVGDKLREEFGLNNGVVQGDNPKAVKAYLDTLLKEGVGFCGDCELEAHRVRSLDKALKKHETLFARMLWSARNRCSEMPFLRRFAALAIEKYYNKQSLWTAQECMGTVQKQLEQQAKRHISAYRSSQLDILLSTFRQELVKFYQALRARSSKSQAELFSELDFSIILKAFPIWLLSIESLSKLLPFKTACFDLVVIDESTQCNSASALPALQRAKRAVIVGDRKQLKHVSFLSHSVQSDIWRKCALEGSLPDKFAYRTQSIMDLASEGIASQQAVIFLDEHFRSKPELIHFSNKHFYADRLKVMQSRPGITQTSALNLVKVNGKRSTSGLNIREQAAIIRALEDLMQEYSDRPRKPSVGVLSPYREQADYLRRKINTHFNAIDIGDYRIKVSTPFGFQGEERDFMYISMVVDTASARAAAYLNREDVFNVAITRAKVKQLVFYSIDVSALPANSLLGRYLSGASVSEEKNSSQNAGCQFAEEVTAYLEARGFKVWESYPVAGQEIDLVCRCGEHLFGLDLIAYPGAYEAHYSLAAYRRFYRSGFKVFPIPYDRWMRSPEEIFEYISQR